MNFIKKLFRKKSHIGTSAPTQINQHAENSEWLDAIRMDVRNLETPDAEQLNHTFNGYLANRHAPIEEIDEALIELIHQGREIVQRAVEIAPDLFEKSLRRYPLDTDHYIDGGEK